MGALLYRIFAVRTGRTHLQLRLKRDNGRAGTTIAQEQSLEAEIIEASRQTEVAPSNCQGTRW